MKKFIVAALGAAVLAAGVPAAANADVLVESKPSQRYCGDAITVGIWAQPGTRASRWVTITARYMNGRVWWRKRAYASTRRWHDWYIAPYNCATTRITYRGAGWRYSYVVRFGIGD
jgi:hypothetical protein